MRARTTSFTTQTAAPASGALDRWTLDRIARPLAGAKLRLQLCRLLVDINISELAGEAGSDRDPVAEEGRREAQVRA